MFYMQKIIKMLYFIKYKQKHDIGIIYPCSAILLSQYWNLPLRKPTSVDRKSELFKVAIHTDILLKNIYKKNVRKKRKNLNNILLNIE